MILKNNFMKLLLCCPISCFLIFDRYHLRSLSCRAAAPDFSSKFTLNYLFRKHFSSRMSLKGFFRKAIKDVYKREGVPQIIEKTFNNIWDAFMKTQPRILSTSNTASSSGLLVDPDLWGILQRCMERYGVNPNVAMKVVRLCKRKFGEKLTPTKIKILLW